MEFRQESVTQVFSQILPLIFKHYREVTVFGEGDLNPSFMRYLNLESQGVARIYVMRDDFRGGLLVGYCSVFVVPHLHYEKSWGMQDLLYVEPEYRGFFARSFIRWVDDRLKKEGVDCISRSVHVKKDYSKTLLGLGYGKLETSYLKVLG